MEYPVQLNEATSTRPLISVVTVTYNDMAGLMATLSNVKSQTLVGYEHIVVDGNSTDGSIDFLHNFINPFLNWISEKDDGIYDAMNKGLALAQGEFIVFMNAGDFFPHDEILRMVSDAIQQASGVIDVIFGGCNYILTNGVCVYRAPKKIEGYIWHGLPANHQATYYRRECVVKYDTKYKICGDYYLAAMLYKKGVRAAYLDMPLVDFRLGDTSYRNPVLLFREPYQIQRDILDMPFPFRVLSMLKRLSSRIALDLMSLTLFRQKI